MPKSKKLQKKISSKLDKLQELLDNFDEVRILNPDDPETWDSDVLYSLVANLKNTLQFLEDKLSTTQRDNFGEPLVLEEGLCTLVDEYFEEEEEEDNDF